MLARTKARLWRIIPILLFVIPVSRSEENVAVRGTAEQSTNHDKAKWPAEKAIDGCTKQAFGTPQCCSHTKDPGHKKAWWRVDLEQCITIQYITIYYRQNSSPRFGGYSLYVSNTTDHTQGILCYQDTSNEEVDVNLNPTHQCPYVAQYVIVYNHRENPKRHDWYDDYAVLELCEVQVYGCPAGSYGDGSCNQTCSKSCYGGNCNSYNGSCFYCFPGMFGAFCEQICSANCTNTCEKDSGHCLECVPGTFGDFCEKTCSNNCLNTCDKDTGHCTDCVPTTFGEFCEQLCSVDCNITCEKETGHCNGCKPGKTGKYCNATCPVNCVACHQTSGECFDCVPGTFGDLCEQNCSTNCNNTCEKEIGHCYGCKPGKTGDHCNRNCSLNCVTCDQTSDKCFECVKGKHGDVCDFDCSENCNETVCKKENGHCLECIPGKKGDLCNVNCSSNCVTCNQTSEQCFECVQGTYGNICDSQCSATCKEHACIKENGNCLECIPGKYGPKCTSDCIGHCKHDICHQDVGFCPECTDGFYGNNCSTPCGNCDICSKDIGDCLSACSDGYEGSACQMKTMPPEPTNGNVGTIIGVVVGVVIVACIIIIGVVFVRRRKQKFTEDSSDDVSRQNVPPRSRQKKSNDADSTEHVMGQKVAYVNIDDIAVRQNSATTSTPTANVYVNANDVVGGSSENLCNVAIADLKALVKMKMANEAKAFQEEYGSLPSGSLHEHKIGMLNENRPKNRFKSTFPYDHSRVVLDKLDNNPHSDYINANYIDSVSSPAKYIATQGPTEQTVDDFWRMVWKLRSGKIVMLTNLTEGIKKKCAKYWPDEGKPMTTKHFDIVLERERVYAYYVIREISLTEKTTRSLRQIRQFHYTTWPDHGTPDPKELVVFHRHVKHISSVLTGKMVVHCSAGIGRTGTFIALDALLDCGTITGNVDITGYIRTMRKDRINMVQTSDQYIAIHNLLIEAFDMPDTLIPRMKYHVKLQSLCNDAPINQTKLWKEYKLLQDTKPTYTENDYKTAMLPGNLKKNRDPNVLAVDKFRAYLLSVSPGRTDYINAVEVPSYTSRTGYIVTQIPFEDTVGDLLTMIMDQNCGTVVIIDNNPVEWLPRDGNDKFIGSFKLRHQGGSSTITDTESMEIAITNQDHRFETSIRVFHMTGWGRDEKVPRDSPDLLQLLELLDRRRKSNDSKKTVVMCRDGFSQSGLFCCISNARDQMKIDEEVDIFQIAKQLLFRRPEFITCFDQYKCCYNMIKDYLDNTDVYMN